MAVRNFERTHSEMRTVRQGTFKWAGAAFLAYLNMRHTGNVIHQDIDLSIIAATLTVARDRAMRWSAHASMLKEAKRL